MRTPVLTAFYSSEALTDAVCKGKLRLTNSGIRIALCELLHDQFTITPHFSPPWVVCHCRRMWAKKDD